MIRALTLLVLLTFPGLATAQALPSLYDVTGVAAHDVLNIRERPTAQSPIIGTLAPTATEIEVIQITDGPTYWGQINRGERAGWVNMRYLVAQEAGIDPGTLPLPLACYGTEPFWSLGIDGRGAANWHLMGNPPVPLSLTAQLQSANHLFHHALTATGADGPLTALIRFQLCSDDMSDRIFGLAIDVLGPGPTLYSGCCSLRPD